MQAEGEVVHFPEVPAAPRLPSLYRGRLDPIAGELGADPRVIAHVHVRFLLSEAPA